MPCSYIQHGQTSDLRTRTKLTTSVGATLSSACSMCQSVDETAKLGNWLCHPAILSSGQKMGRNQGVELCVQIASIGFSPDSHPEICDWGLALLPGAQLVYSWRFPLIPTSWFLHLFLLFLVQLSGCGEKHPLRDCGKTLPRLCESGNIFTTSSHKPGDLGRIPSLR